MRNDSAVSGSTSGKPPTSTVGFLPVLIQWWIPLFLYLMVAGFAAYLQREQMNGDGVAYLRHAFYLSEGRWADAVSGYWSPLFIWSTAPLIAMGMDGVYAGHLAMVGWGAGLLAGSYFFLKRFCRLSVAWTTLIMLLLALKCAVLVPALLTPDVGFAALLLIYAGMSLDPRILQRRSWAWGAGMVGGFSYLAKSYGLPFFLSHFTLILAGHYWMNRRETSLRQVAVSWVIGLVGFLLIAGPWIGVLSVKHGRPTFSTVAKVAHSVKGPADMPRAHPTDELREVPAGRITIWETPHVLPYNHWSPLASRSYFVHQIKVVVSNFLKIWSTLTTFDLLYLFPAAFFLLPLALVAQGNLVMAPRTIWLWITAGLYLGGFLPIFYEARYIHPFVWPLCVVFLFGVLVSADGLQAFYRTLSARRGTTDPQRPITTGIFTSRALTFAGLVVAFSFAWPILFELQASIRNPAPPTWRGIANTIKADGLNGPLASSPGLKTEGMVTAYLAGEQFLGPVSGASVQVMEASLERFGVKLLLVRTSKWPFAEEFLKTTTWHSHREWRIDGATVVLLRPPAPN